MLAGAPLAGAPLAGAPPSSSTGAQADAAQTVTAGAVADGVRATAGAATQAITAGASADGVIGKSGAAPQAATAGATADGARGTSGGGAQTVTAGASADGVLGAVSSAFQTVAAGATADGVRGAVGAASQTVTAGATADGQANASSQSAAAQAITAGAAAGGTIAAASTGSQAATAGAAADGVRGAVGAATQAATAGATAGGVRGAVGAASQTATAGAATDGVRGAVGAASQTVTAGGAADGVRAAAGAASQTVTAGGAADGSRALAGAASQTVTSGATADGQTTTAVTVAVASASSAATGSGNVTVTKPSGTADGDLLIAFAFSDPDAGSASTITAPAGWTQRGGDGSSAAGYGRVYTRTAASEGASWTWTMSSSSANAVHVLRVTGSSGALTVTPVWAASGAVATTSHAAPSVSPAGPVSLLVTAVWGIYAAAATYTPASGMTEATDARDSGDWAAVETAWAALSAAGPTGTRTATSSAATLATFGNLCVSLAVGVAATSSAVQAVTAGGSAAGTVTPGGPSAFQTITAGATAAGWVGAHGGAAQTATAGAASTGSYGAVGAAAQAVTAGAAADGAGAIPVFPESPLPVTVSLRVDDAWLDITRWVYGRDTTPIKITRGRTGEGATTERQSATLQLNNRDGRFSPRNPNSPLYGKITRNTPLQIAVNEGGPYLAATTSGVWASAPDTTALSSSGDLDVRVDLHGTAWGSTGTLIGKWDYSSQLSWLLTIDKRTPTLQWRQAGATVQARGRVALPVGDVGRVAVRATLDCDDGSGAWAVTFWTAASIAGPWMQLGAPVRGSTVAAITDSTAPLIVGDGGYGYIPGRYYAAQVRIAGTVVADPTFTEQIVAAPTFFDDAGNTWTLSGEDALSNRHVRFTGEVSEWPQKWDVTGRDAWVPVTVSGIIRRLGQGQSPVRSVLSSTLPSLPGVVAYWPCEDGANAQSVAGGMPGVRPMVVSYTGEAPAFASNTAFRASAPLPVLKTGRFDGIVPAYTATGQTTIRFLMMAPKSGATDLAQVLHVYTSGTAAKWEIVYGIANSGSLQLNAYSRNDVSIQTGPFDVSGLDGIPYQIDLTLTETGGGIYWELLYSKPGAGGGVVTWGNISGRTVGAVKRITIGKSGTLGDTAIGHVMVRSTVTSIFDAAEQVNAYRGERAATRMSRLSSENSVSLVTVGAPSSTVKAGYQKQATYLDIVKEAAVADGGILFEPKDTVAVAYRTRAGLERQNPRLSLSYPGHQMSKLDPIEDDRYTANLVKVTRADGASATAELTDGPMSTAQPPAGVGRYDTSVTLSLAEDQDAARQAYWRLHLGTVDEARYPTLPVNLATRAFTGSPSLVTDVLEADIGDRLQVTDPPMWVPPDAISQIIQGYSEEIGQFLHRITWNLAPESPYRVAVFDDGESRYTSDGSTLAAAVTEAATSISVATPSGPTWRHTDGDFDIIIGGERMTVTGITGTASPQTFTVTRAVNGITKPHDAGSVVELFTPYYYSL